MDETVYEAAGGAPAMRALARAWHARCLEDELTRHPFSHPGQHPDHLERLAAYWGEQLGGPAVYTGLYGSHGGVLRMHSGNGEHADLDEAAQACFALALDDAGIPAGLRGLLRDWFRWAVGLMAAHPHDPGAGGLEPPLPRWGWHGPESPSDPGPER
ncbi:globin domain-containing protein [Glycomyces terrestris]|uniref:Oxidoreductase n=1 Tax=Glycomyces terrestris TaxID=2493553 RepID=A0A426UVF8_9ACTN|nr:oxidoreductase [Glycomyces terrestris]RRR98304.1 oxidoreductase [Glycomyces terrestris]